MSNVPDDKRPQSDVADQLAGTPSADNDTTAADASPLTGDATVGSEQPEQPSEPTPLVEPVPEPPLEPSSDPVFASDAGSDSVGAQEPTAAAEAAPLPDGVSGMSATDSSEQQEPAASAHPISDPVAEPAAPAAVPVTHTEQHAAPQTVYVTAPTPPKKRSNRGIGTLLAVLGTIAFALLHGMITAIAYVSAGRAFDVARFVGSTGFLVPTIVFLVVFVLAVLIINRAGWWAWVLGSLVVAVATYFLSIGIIMLLENVVAMTPAEAQFVWEQLAVSAPMVVAIIVAREVAVWFGLAIAARGRRVKARNVEAREAYDREVAENRARYGTTYA